MMNKTAQNFSTRDVKVTGMPAPAWHKSAAVGSVTMAGVNFRTTSGTTKSIPGIKVGAGSLLSAAGKSNR